MNYRLNTFQFIRSMSIVKKKNPFCMLYQIIDSISDIDCIALFYGDSVAFIRIPEDDDILYNKGKLRQKIEFQIGGNKKWLQVKWNDYSSEMFQERFEGIYRNCSFGPLIYDSYDYFLNH